MNTLIEAARSLQSFLELQYWRFCFIGGLAVLRWGEPRLTRDIDVTLLCPFGREDDVTVPLLNNGYTPRISDAREFARRNRVLLLQSRDAIPIDIALGTLPFEEAMIERATLFEFEPDCSLRTCSAEDLVVLKLFACRPRDVVDAEGIAIRRQGKLDWPYIEANLAPLAEVRDQPEIMNTLRRVRSL
jgi:hypothetical protein